MKHHIPFLIVWLVCILVISACSPSNVQSSQNTPDQASPTLTPTLTLATPYAQLPAAGICASFDGEVVTITLDIDMPAPRCAKVRPDQTLSVVNNTLSTLRVSIADFSHSLLPGETYTIDVPFGDYLAAGVHQLAVEPCCGAELWLEASK